VVYCVVWLCCVWFRFLVWCVFTCVKINMKLRFACVWLSMVLLDKTKHV
jgi:hypothetical protein